MPPAATHEQSHSQPAGQVRIAAAPFAFNRPGHRWKRDYVGDGLAGLTLVGSIALIAALAFRLAA